MHVGTEERIGLTTDCGDSSEDESEGWDAPHENGALTNETREEVAGEHEGEEASGSDSDSE